MDKPELQYTGKTPGHLDSTAIAVSGALLILLVIVVVVAAQAWYYNFQRKAVEEANYHVRPADVVQYQAEQDQKLNSFRRRADGSAAIPIQEAMKLYLQR